MTNKKNILIIKHGAFGDIIESEGIMRAIKNYHLQSKITYLTSSKFKSLISCFDYIDDIIVDNRAPIWNLSKNLLLLKKIKNCKFDVKNFFLVKSKWVSTNRKNHPISGHEGLIEMLENHRIQDKNSYIPDISWLASDVSQLLKENNIKSRFIVLIPGSSINHKDKRWPYFPNLSMELIKKGFDVVNILGPDEESIESNFHGKILKNLSWGNLVGIINKSSIVIGNDTGPIHIASCLGKRGIALFGPTNALQSGLLRSKFTAIEADKLSEITQKKVMKRILIQLNLN